MKGRDGETIWLDAQGFEMKEDVNRPKSIYDKLPEKFRPFDWATPAKLPEGQPKPWRVSNKEKASRWLKRVFKKIDDDLDIYVDTYGVNAWRGKEQLWVSVRDNRNNAKANAAIKEMAGKLKGMAEVRLVKPRRPDDSLSTWSMYLVDDLERNVIRPAGNTMEAFIAERQAKFAKIEK
jgi:hypothetical protein